MRILTQVENGVETETELGEIAPSEICIGSGISGIRVLDLTGDSVVRHGDIFTIFVNNEVNALVHQNVDDHVLLFLPPLCLLVKLDWLCLLNLFKIPCEWVKGV